MANKTVAAVVKMIDQFTNPSKEVARSASNLEKRFKEVSKGFTAVGSVFDSVGSTLTKSVTAPLMAVGAASMKAFSDVDNAVDTIIKKTGASGKAMDEFKKNFENVATKVPAELDDVGAAIGEINTRLGLTGKPLEEATEKFLKFAELNGTDVEGSIQTVTRAMGDAGIAAEDYGKILDQLNVAGQVSGISVDALAENLAKFGAPMRALGIDTKKSIAMFAGWEKAGVNTSIAFSGMKKAISQWGKDGKDAGKEFSAVMQKIKEAPDISAATSMAIEAFGAKAGPDLADAIRGGRFEVDEYIKALENAGGSVDNTFSETADGIDKLKTAGNAAKIALAEFGGVISEEVAPYLDKATESIKKATEWFKNLDDAEKKAIVKYGAIAAAIGPGLSIFGKLITGIGSVINSMGMLGKGFTKIFGGFIKVGEGAGKATDLFAKLGAGAGKIGAVFKGLASFLTGPVGIAIAAIVAGAFLIRQNWDKINPIIQKIINRFKEFGAKVKPDIDAFLETMKPVVAFLKDVFSKAFDVALGAASGWIVQFFENASGYIGKILGVFEGLIKFISGVFTGNWSKAWEGIRDIVSNAFGALVGLVKAPLNSVIALINGAITEINKISFDVPDWVPKFGGKHFGANIPTIPQLAKGTDNWVGGVVQVHERGGEIIDLPKGSRVYPHDESVQKAREEGKKSITIAIAKLADQIVVREDADIDKIASALAAKLEQKAINMA